MNQPPHIGSRGGFGLGDARPPGMAVLWKTPELLNDMVAKEVWTTCHRIDLKRTWIDLERNSDDLDDLDRVVYAMKEVRRECGTYRYILVMCKCS